MMFLLFQAALLSDFSGLLAALCLIFLLVSHSRTLYGAKDCQTGHFTVECLCMCTCFGTIALCITVCEVALDMALT